MSKNRQNKNDRKRQRRKEFNHGRDWSTTSQDQRSPYPKSSVALRADAARRAQLAGIKSIDISPGAINTISGPSLKQTHIMQLMQDMQDAMMQQMLYGAPSSLSAGLWRIPDDYNIPERPALKREMKVGEIHAYRCWRYQEGLLRSVYFHDFWQPGQIMVGRDIQDWSERGVHAWKDLNSRKFNDYVRGYLSTRKGSLWPHYKYESTVIVTGTVLLWGDVVEHEHGYRAEFAKINSIDWIYPNAELMGRERETLAKLRNLYGVS